MEPQLARYESSNSRLPNGHPIYDPDFENIKHYLEQTYDPQTYFLRKEFPPSKETFVEELAKNFDSEMDAKTQEVIDFQLEAKNEDH